MTIAEEMRELTRQGLAGHSRAAHRVHGWCSKCPGRELWEEILAWRQRENQVHDDGLEGRDRITAVPGPAGSNNGGQEAADA